MRVLYLIIVHFFVVTQVLCQKQGGAGVFNQVLTNSHQDKNTNFSSDSLAQNQDSLTAQSPLKLSNSSLTQVDTVDIVFDDDEMEGPITYSADDSIVYDIKNKKLILYTGAKMKYTTIDLESDQVEFDWTTYTLTAKGKFDSAGNAVEAASFTESSGTYAADSMQYNFKTKKGRTYDVVTEQDGAYIHSEIVQKNEYDEWYGYKTKYTTCTDIEHPHFYLGANKSKVVPNKIMVTGPVNLVVSDVNTPIYLPFGIFPTKNGRRSGIVMPQYGEQPDAGFFLKNGGYFWAVNDRLSLTFLGDIYTRGQFGLSAKADYKKMYKYQGSFFFNYFRTPDAFSVVNDRQARNDVNIQWTHNMDGKARPNNSFSASVSGKTSGYNNNSRQTDQQLLEVQLTSNINYVRRFTGKPYNFSISAKHNQNLKTHAIGVTLPELAFNVSRFTPFQRKIQSEKKAFYEKIGFTYSAKAKAAISTIDSVLFKKESLENIQYGMIQSASIDAPFNLFKYFVVNPSFSYNERWYFKQEDRFFVGDSIQSGENLVYRATDSNYKNGFFGVRDFNFSTNVSTTITGIYNFKSKNLKAIRHVMKPTMTYTFKPDFSKPSWNYYDSYINGENLQEVSYNRYAFLTNLYGIPTSGLQNAVTLNIRNNFDMKIVDKKDSLESLKKVPLIEQFNVQTGYDFTADSLKMQPLVISAQSSLFNKLLTWNIGANFDPYALNDKRQKINESYLNSNKRLLRFNTASVAVQFNLTGKPKNKDDKKAMHGTVEERQFIANNPGMFYDFNIPWSLSFGYNLNITKGVAGNIDSTVISTNVLTVGGHINLTPKWQVNVTTGYDIKGKDFTLTKMRVERDLHCWVLAFDWVAYPLSRQTYTIDLHVKSAILQELKLSRKQPPGTSGAVF